MTKNIYDLANELERTIRDLPEYKAVVEARQLIDGDSESKALLDDYVAFQTRIQAGLQAGNMPNEEDEKQMTSYIEQIQSNVQLSTFFAKQQQLSVYIADIEKIIFTPMQELLK